MLMSARGRFLAGIRGGIGMKPYLSDCRRQGTSAHLMDGSGWDLPLQAVISRWEGHSRIFPRSLTKAGLDRYEAGLCVNRRSSSLAGRYECRHDSQTNSIVRWATECWPTCLELMLETATRPDNE